MGKTDGTLDHHWNTIIMSNFMYHQPMSLDMLTQLIVPKQIPLPSITPENDLNQSETDTISIL